MRCACDTDIKSISLFSCNIYPSRIKRLIFTKGDLITATSSNPNAVPSSWAILFAPSNNLCAFQNGNFNNTTTVETIYYNPTSYRLFSEIIDVFESTREEDVREELDGTPFFVRRGKRSLNVKFVQKNLELVRFLEELRCHDDLYLFLIDEDGVAWGLRTHNPSKPIAGIKVLSATISSMAEFASASTTEKIMLSLTFDDFSDGDLIPLIDNSRHQQLGGVDLLTYRAPVRISADYAILAGNLVVNLYIPIATSAGNINVPVSGYASALQIYNNATLLANTFTEISPGLYQTTLPAAWTHIVFDNTLSYTQNYDFCSFRLNR